MGLTVQCTKLNRNRTSKMAYLILLSTVPPPCIAVVRMVEASHVSPLVVYEDSVL